jgi:hypothetical protein
MNPPTSTTLARSQQIDVVSRQLLPGAALLTRLIVRQLGGEVSRTEVGLLSTLSRGPQRITTLAELEGLAQPTLEDYRSRVHALLGTYLAEIPDEQVEALAAATDALAGLIALLQP